MLRTRWHPLAVRSRRPGAKFEIESADDFVTTATQTLINSATFTGLLTGGATTANVGTVTVEIYRVFPKDSDVGRTSGPPTFSTPQVPTRVNSPSDVEFVGRSTTSGDLSVKTSLLSPTFTALNSVQPGGIHPMPGQTTGGNGQITGQEVLFTVNFTTPIDLSPDHYFFVPQVEVTTASGEFLWLSGTRPTPHSHQALQICRAGRVTQCLIQTGSASERTSSEMELRHRLSTLPFRLMGLQTPLPGALPLFATGLGALGLLGWRKKAEGRQLPDQAVIRF